MLITDSSNAGEDTSTTLNMNTTEPSSSSRLYWDEEQTPHGKKRSVSGANSSHDPSVQSSQGEKTFSNTRHHPKAELVVKSDRNKNSLNHNHSSSDSKNIDRKRKSLIEDDDDVWTEHRSSSGRLYFYNKRLDKSQWEKPLKGIVKRLKPEPQSSSSRSSSQTTGSKSRSHTGRSSNSSKGHHNTGTYHHSEHYSSKRKPDKRSTPFQSKTTEGNNVTSPVSNKHSTSLPTPNRLPSHLISTPEGLSTYMASGPTTPVHTFVGWSGMEASPVTPGSDGSTLHPLQRALILQNQYSQGYQFSPHNSTSLPTTSLQTHTPVHSLAATPSTPVTPIAGGVPMIYPQNLISVYHSEPLVSYSQKLQVPMSKLGTWLLNEDGFPDPTLLKPLSQLPNNDFFNPTLTQQWSGSLENCLKQMDNSHFETLSRTTIDLGYHCGQLAKNLLALECCRMKTVSRRTRITDLTKTIEMIEKTTH